MDSNSEWCDKWKIQCISFVFSINSNFIKTYPQHSYSAFNIDNNLSTNSEIRMGTHHWKTQTHRDHSIHYSVSAKRELSHHIWEINKTKSFHSML